MIGGLRIPMFFISAFILKGLFQKCAAPPLWDIKGWIFQHHNGQEPRITRLDCLSVDLFQPLISINSRVYRLFLYPKLAITYIIAKISDDFFTFGSIRLSFFQKKNVHTSPPANADKKNADVWQTADIRTYFDSPKHTSIFRAESETWTRDPFITSEVLYHWAVFISDSKSALYWCFIIFSYSLWEVYGKFCHHLQVNKMCYKFLNFTMLSFWLPIVQSRVNFHKCIIF